MFPLYVKFHDTETSMENGYRDRYGIEIIF